MNGSKRNLYNIWVREHFIYIRSYNIFHIFYFIIIICVCVFYISNPSMIVLLQLFRCSINLLHRKWKNRLSYIMRIPLWLRFFYIVLCPYYDITSPKMTAAAELIIILILPTNSFWTSPSSSCWPFVFTALRWFSAPSPFCFF